MKTDILQFISKMSELEIVDSFNAIERYLLAEMQVHLSCIIFRLLCLVFHDFLPPFV